MRKRVALARALMLEPKVVLYDEFPWPAIDPQNITRIDRLILRLQQQLGLTSVIATHDMPTAFEVCDRIALLHEGHFAHVLTPSEMRDCNRPRASGLRRRRPKSLPAADLAFPGLASPAHALTRVACHGQKWGPLAGYERHLIVGQKTREPRPSIIDFTKVHCPKYANPRAHRGSFPHPRGGKFANSSRPRPADPRPAQILARAGEDPGCNDHACAYGRCIFGLHSTRPIRGSRHGRK